MGAASHGLYRLCDDRVMGDTAYDRLYEIERGGEKSITINHGCGGGGDDSMVVAATSEVQSKLILMGHPVSSCHVPVVRSFFILFQTSTSS